MPDVTQLFCTCMRFGGWNGFHVDVRRRESVTLPNTIPGWAMERNMDGVGLRCDHDTCIAPTAHTHLWKTIQGEGDEKR